MANATAASGGKADNVVRLNDNRETRSDSLLRIRVRRFFKHRMAVVGVVLLSLIILYVTAGSLVMTEAQANRTNLTNKFGAPTADSPFGTDGIGRDIFGRTIYGGQISLMIGITSVAITITVGTMVGLISGYFGGMVDTLLMRFVEALLVIPQLTLLIVIQPFLISKATTTFNLFGRQLSATVIAIILIFGLLSWLGLSRIVRSMVLSLKEQEFVVAARMLGAGHMRIIFQHILPNCVAPIVVSATLGVGGAIIGETALGFLGFGVQEPTATWGNILSNARNYIDQYPWLWMAPGALITITVLSINFIGDGLRDAFDPRSMK
jgi:peptide/nickel transport system permease protein